MGDRGDRLDVRHVRVGVADRLDEERLGAVGDGRLPRTEVARVDEFHLDADPPEGDAHHVDRAAVDADGGDDLVPRAREVQKGVDHRRVPRREGKRADAAVQRGHPALERVDGGIAQAGVDVARLLELKEPRRVLGAVEGVGGRLVDGQRHRMGLGVGLGARVHHQRVEAVIFIRVIQHLNSSRVAKFLEICLFFCRNFWYTVGRYWLF